MSLDDIELGDVSHHPELKESPVEDRAFKVRGRLLLDVQNVQRKELAR